MNTRLIRTVFAGAVLAQSGVFAQSAAVVDLKDFRPREVKSEVFSLASAQDVRVEAVGAEASNDRGTFSWITAMWKDRNDGRRDPWMGNAWILDLKNRRVVWELSAASTERGRRNTRAFAGAVRLPAGTYEAFYSPFPNMYWTDGKGDASTTQRFLNWLADEGFDEFRMTIRGNAQVLRGAEAERARHEFESGAIVTLRGDGGRKFLESGFILSRPTEVEIYAAGEAREDGDFDAGWIVNAETREKIWKLTWRASAPAGGAEKNRMARLSKTLPAGRYAAFYATDDSHDTTQWNAAPPHDPYAWGLIVRVPDAAARATVKPFSYAENPDPSIVAQIVRLHDHENKRRTFKLDRETQIRIFALGEGTGRLVDYGWIEDAKTGKAIWEMTYRATEPAGGAAKNRRFDGRITLPAGEYVLRYETDDSHSFGAWNAGPPDEPEMWGITVYRVKS
jgi:hypothetical protein